jgi:hypothetical protein
MGALTGQTIAASYEQLLHVDTDGGGATTTLVPVKDGDNGTTFCLQLATTSALISGSGSKLLFSDNGGEYISGDGTDLTITSGRHIVLALGSAGSVYHTGDGGTSNTIYGKDAGIALASGGNYNVFLGENAGEAITVSDDNVAIGYNAFFRGTTQADKNVAIGSNAMSGNFTTADVDSCVIIGYDAGSGTLTSGATGTVAIGHQAAKALTSGTTNTAVGYQTGLLCTTASDNTYIGHTVGVATHVDDFANTAVGSGAYSGTHTGSVNQYNTAIGYNSMDAAMNGALKNTAVGAGSLGAITTGVQNVGIGYDAGNDITTGNNNVMLGHQAGDKSSNVDNAVIIGSDAGADNMTAAADGSIGIGASALTSLTTGASNLAIGYSALANNIDGDNNTAIGWQALQTFEAASDGDGHNVAIGMNALQAATTGQYNTVVGTLAGDELTTGAYNVLVGYQAMHNADGGENENTCLGYQAGTNIDNGSGNVMIGSNSTASTAAASNQTVIGKDAAGVADNSVTLGNDDTVALAIGNARYRAWDTANTFRSIQLGSTVQLACQTSTGDTGQLHLTNNAFYDDTDNRWEAINTGESATMNINDDGHIFFLVSQGSDSAAAEVALATAVKIANTGEVTMPLQPAFCVNPASTQDDIAVGSSTTVVWGTERFDQGGDFASNTFTAPVTGRYQLQVTVSITNMDISATNFGLLILTSNKQYERWVTPDQLLAGDDNHSMTMACLADMDASDTVVVNMYQVGGAAQADIHPDSHFSGFLAC